MTRLTPQFLTHINACQLGIKFIVKQKLIGYPLNKLHLIAGDYHEYVKWIRYNMYSKYTLNDDGNVIFIETPDFKQLWFEYDDNGNLIHYKDSYGIERWHTYDTHGNVITTKYRTFAEWHEYDEHGNKIYTKNSYGSFINMEYNKHGDITYSKTNEDRECWYYYDERGNLVMTKNNNEELKYQSNIHYYNDGQLKQYNGLIIPYFDKKENYDY